MAFRQIKTPAIANSAVTNAKLAASSVNSQTSISGADLSNDELVIYDNSATALAKITVTNLLGSGTTDNISEGSTNLYFTNGRFDARFDAYASGGTGVTLNSGAISIGQAVATTDTVEFAGVTAPLTGNVTGNLDGIVGGNTPAAGSFTTIGASSTITGNLTGNVTGNVTGNLDGIIGGNTPAAVTGTTVTGTTFVGPIDGIVGGNTPAAVTGTTITANTGLVGDLTGDVAGDVTSTGTSTFATVDINSGAIDNAIIGANTAAAGNFTTVDTTGNVTVGGNLTVSGTTTTVNSNTIELGDNIIILNNDVTGSPTENSGIEVERGTSGNARFIWDETNDRWSSEVFDGSSFVAAPVNMSAVSAAMFTGDLTGDIYASNGTSKVLESGTNGSDSTYTGDVTGDLTGNVTGNVTGDLTGDVTGCLLYTSPSPRD